VLYALALTNPRAKDWGLEIRNELGRVRTPPLPAL